MEADKLINSVQNMRNQYSDLYVFRAAAQAIPAIGGFLDTLLAGRAGAIQLERVMKLISEITIRLETVETISANISGEEFGDLIFTAFEKSARTRSDEKRARFANIIVQQLISPQPWEESEDALRLLSAVEDIHITVLAFALQAPLGQQGFEDLKVIGLNGSMGALSLQAHLQEFSIQRLRMACSELVAKGLLYDEGIGRLGGTAMDVLVATDLAEWFGHWIAIYRKQ